MARITSEQRQKTQNDLLHKGRELFIQYGFFKTSIDDIVQACGIAKGSFYTYYSSKEELYYAVLRKEEAIKKEIIEEIMRETLPLKELLIRFFEKSWQAIEGNPFLRSVYQRGEFERIVARLPQELLDEHAREDLEDSVEFVNWLQAQGITETDPEVLIGLFRTVILIPLHRAEIGEEIFPKMMAKMIACLAEGLTKEA
ncbi:TetR/AcrR family transcriptional regulator [Brevibacillus reuszeri]|uniref:TetR/AcrR family transcriptional regulator n=1 Tax=Brevibacillus reuszeri TaxID=54915 RepID=UPI00289D632A|nr:TetR/AcrR family transcriptional regulator [Brevibacillus reuszeri]